MNRLSPWLLLLLVLTVWVPAGCGDEQHSHPLARSCSQQAQRYLYVSTVDGGLTALDEEGNKLWTYTAKKPLFYSTFSQAENKGMANKIVPSLDRGIYHWDGIKLAKLPFTADDLIERSQLLSGQHSILAGARANDVVGINVHTGKPIYECSHEKCQRYDNQSFIQRMDVLKLSTSRVTVREATDLTGEEIWNFTVGNMELMLVEGEEGSEGHSCSISDDLQWELHVDTVMGLVYTTRRNDLGHHLWEVKLGAPVVRAWLHQGGKLEAVSLSAHVSDRLHPSLMMVEYRDQYYLQPVGPQAPQAVGPQAVGLGGKEGITAPTQGAVQFYYRHFTLATGLPNMAAEYGVSTQEEGSGGGGSSLMLYYNHDTFLEMCSQGPNGLAVYFYLDPSPNETHQTNDASDTGHGENVCSVPPPGTLDSTPEGAAQHWLVRKAYSVVKYLLFGAFVLACNKLRRYLKVHRLRTDSTSTNLVTDDDEFPFFDQLFRRHSSLSDTASTPLARTPSLVSSSTETLTSSLTRSNSVPESSRVLPRFGSDYQLKGRLGKGGFGVVYHVQNKTDGGEYAVKRIRLPTNKAAKDKVMREVRALAQLDHPRIVRYFNSWVEKAPVGWNEMEEWMPLSRRPSYILQDQASSSSSPSPAPLLPPPPPPHGKLTTHQHNLSPCPSFTNLSHSNIHSVVPPPLTTDSRSGSFVIEFRDDSGAQSSEDQGPGGGEVQRKGTQCPNGQLLPDLAISSVSGSVPTGSGDSCFSRAMLRDRDDLSYTGSSKTTTQDTHDKEEGRDCVADLGAEPPTYLFIQMQLCQKESLKDWLRSNITNRCHGKVLHFFDQILDAVRYVHSKGMMHRDLKPSNIFFSLEGNIKVGDFGLVTSTTYGGLHNSYLALKGLVGPGGEEQGHRQHTGNLGTHLYMSPEQVSGKKYDHKVDIYSLGVIFFELHYPFSTDMERAKVLEDVRQHKFPSTFEAKLPLQAELVKWLMAHEASERPVANDVYISSKFKELHENLMSVIPKL